MFTSASAEGPIARMERITGINHGRIKWCCNDSHVSVRQLALETGIAEASLAKVLDGETGLTFKQLTKIADYFGRGVLFFLEEGPIDNSQVHTAAFRTLTNQKPDLSLKVKSLIERAERQRDLYISLREELDDLEQSFSHPTLPTDLDQAAIATREWLRLGSENNFDSYRTAVERKGILVFRSNGYHGKWQISKDNPILGFSLYSPTCPVILVKKQYWETRQTFTLLHELGHILLHRTSSIDDDCDLHALKGSEREANAFAGKVLVPDTFLSRISDRLKPSDVIGFDEWLSPYRRTWGVSTEVLLRRLLDNGRISADEYNSYRAWRQSIPTPEQESGGSRAYRHREPKHIFGDSFVRVVLDSLSARKITLAKASTYLDGLKINDLHALEKHYAGI